MISTLGIIIIISYLALIGSLTIGFDKVSTFRLSDKSPVTKFSIIIPIRNESHHIKGLFDAITALNYPTDRFEILLINDHSTDNSASLVQKMITAYNLKNVSLIPAEKEGKKAAINQAVSIAKYDWIVTSDADCIIPPYWLDCFDEFIQSHDAYLIAAPVTYYTTSSFLDRFQLLDILSLQGATIGGFGIGKPFMCNGANLAYKKVIFESNNVYDNHQNLATGDDVFLLETLRKRYPEKMHYLKCEHAIVTTSAESTFSSLVEQRIRWASKTKHYSFWFALLSGIIVLLSNALIVSSILLYITEFISLKVAFYILVIKLSIDFLLIYKTARFFKQEHTMLSYPFSSLLYPFFSVYIAVASQFKTYKWKGRSSKN